MHSFNSSNPQKIRGVRIPSIIPSMRSAWDRRKISMNVRGPIYALHQAKINHSSCRSISLWRQWRSRENGGKSARLEEHALAVYSLGHLPMIGEWVALPLSRAPGSKEIGDAISEEYLYPVAGRLLERCDAVVRIPGQSKGADQDVRIAKERGLQIFQRIEEIPKLS
jgi:hypothetical protein